MSDTPPSPALFFDVINAYQKTAALKAAIELDLFTHLDESPARSAVLASRCSAAPRGVRILCDFLVIHGFLEKLAEEYALTRDSAVFLSRRSPAYAGGAVAFLLSPEISGAYDDLAAAVRHGGTVCGELGTVAPEHPVWLEFARSMGPLMQPNAQALAELVPLPPEAPATVLDISASHGAYGIAFAQRFPQVRLVALDWAPVLEITRENAVAAGLAERFSTIAGSAFSAELGSGYDVALIPNFLHHFSMADCVVFLRRIHMALDFGGHIGIVEFVPNPDRVSPPTAAGFSLVMLGTTPEGDAYTFAEYDAMLREAGFTGIRAERLPAGEATAVLAIKR